MKQAQFTSTRQFNFKFENYSFGATGTAAKKIAAGETVKFDVFNRDNKNDSCQLSYKNSFYFGLLILEEGEAPALRVSHCRNLDAAESHSIIASWNNQAADPVFIAAALTNFLVNKGSDFFINDEEVAEEKIYTVNIGNIGNLTYTDRKEAEETYNSYVGLSKSNYGRVAGESVTLFEGDEIIKEYQGTIDEQEAGEE